MYLRYVLVPSKVNNDMQATTNIIDPRLIIDRVGPHFLSFGFPVTMVFFSIASWETFLRILLPQASAMHICWMFRLHGSARLVRLAEWLYCFTFDLCTRVGSNTPAAVRKTMLPSSSGVRHPVPYKIYKCSRLTFFQNNYFKTP